MKNQERAKTLENIDASYVNISDEGDSHIDFETSRDPTHVHSKQKYLGTYCC